MERSDASSEHERPSEPGTAGPGQSWPAAGFLMVAGAAALWGTVGVASKGLYGVTAISPLSVGFLRLALSVPLLLALSAHLFGRRTFAFHGRERLLVLLLGAAMALYQVFYFTAVARAGVAIATLVTICTAPLLVALLSGLVLGERITARVSLALATGLSGTILLVGFPSGLEADRAAVFAGVAWASGSALSYAVFTLCSRALARKHHPFQLIAVGFGAGALILMPFALSDGLPLVHPVIGWAMLIYIGLVPTALAYVLYFRGMRETPATTASIVTLLEPLTATVLAWLLFDERLQLLGLLGGLMLLGSIVILRSGPRPSPQ